MNKRVVSFFVFFISLLGSISLIAAAAVTLDSNTFGALEARSIGPAAMGGRIMAIDGVHKDPKTIYVGAASGGVWKTMNGGITFKPVFDKHTQSIGAIAVDQTNPNIVWVGTGESCTRNSASVGTGIYKSTDAGETWQLMGLEKSERIARIVIDPKNSDIVYVAVPGHLWNANEDRGVYKTTDGGKTWKKILYVNADTGAADLALDPQDSNIVYASLWQFRRLPYFFTSGGPGSGLYKSVDGGNTWKKLTAGLPQGDLGRIAIAVAPSRPSVIYANVEAKKTALYRSTDMGETWQMRSTSFNIQARPFYFSHLVVDWKDYNRVYKPGFSLGISEDGGQSFTTPFSGGGNVHSDHHALWINPQDPWQVYLGTDGGLYVSHDRGSTWNFLNNLPLSQFYHVSFDMEYPYNVYGGLQDNGSWMGPSQSPNGIENKDWTNIGFGDGFYVFVDPLDKDIIYEEFQGGKILRHHRSTGETKEIQPYAAQGGPKLRFNWNTPIEISPKNPRMLFVGAQYVFRSTDQGESWERISPDLTTNDPKKQKQEESGGLTIDNSTAENHCTIFTISASPLNENLIWTGSDDGLVHVTRDGGKNWINVTRNIPGLPAHTWVSSIEASPHEEGTAFATFDGHQTGDMKTYIYRTTDFGQTWTSIAKDAIKGYAHIIRQDPEFKDLLFVGTEFGLFLTVDGGQQWAQFTGGLPNVSVRDLAIHPRESDLIIATHGRGIYIVDDFSVLRQLTPEVLQSQVAFLKGRDSAIRFPDYRQEANGDSEFVGSNLQEAATISYYLKDRHVFGDLKIEIYDQQGNLVTTLPGGKRKGINRVKWFMRLKPPKVPPAPTLAFGALVGPTVPEGVYRIKLIKDKETYTSEIKLVADPRLKHSPEDRKMQQDLVMKLYRMQERLAFVADTITDLRDQAKDRASKLKKGESTARTLTTFADRLDQLHRTLVATKEGFLTGEEKLRERVVDLYMFVSNYGGRPTNSQIAEAAVLEREIEKANSQFETIIGKELQNINDKLKGKRLEPMRVMTEEEWDKKQT